MGHSYEQRMRLVREWKRSGLKAAEFARQKGIKQQALHNWSCQLNKQSVKRKHGRPTGDVRLLPVHVTPSAEVFDHIDRRRGGSVLSIKVDRDGRVRVELAPDADIRRVAALIALLRVSPC